MAKASNPSRSANVPAEPVWVAALLGVFACLCLLKFPTPTVLQDRVEAPKNVYVLIFSDWPIGWGYGVLALLLAACGWLLVRQARELGRPVWRSGWLWLPAAWLAWQFLAAIRTLDADLTGRTLPHFLVCVVMFYAGFTALREPRCRDRFLALLTAGFLVVLWTGIYQHFWGLEELRRMFQLQLLADPSLRDSLPEGFEVKVQSDRIWSTLFYANSFAAAIVLLTPAGSICIWRWASRRMTPPARGVLVGLVALSALACLFWTGSKTGWLVAMALGGVAVLRMRFDKRIKIALVAVVAAGGLTGFFVVYKDYFQKGATSLGARFDYWKAAWETSLDHPLTGSGPGTFYRAYEQRKRPDAEVARLAHNDFLQQASDSGWPGFGLYTLFVGGVLVRSGRRVLASPDRTSFAVWLGVLGWVLAGLMDFPLYCPALAWPAFLCLGFLESAAKSPPEAGDSSSL